VTGIADMFSELDGYVDYHTALAIRAALPPTDAERERWRRAKNIRRQRIAAGLNTKHSFAAYGAGCRCDVCRAANTKYMREYQRRRAKEPAFRAKRRGYDKARREERRAAA
jgi:hypothetical protein